MAMRDVLCEELYKLMQNDEKVVVIDADLAKADGTFNLRKSFPDRAFDVGIAEANMTSIAAGMSSYGFKPWITSFTPFVSRRNADQIAISVAYSKQNVKIVGTDPGITAELNGGTHMGIEDVGILRSIPNTVIVEIIDEVQLRKAIPVINDYHGCVYLRMFRKDCPIVTKEDYEFDLFKADTLKKGVDVSIFATGIMVETALNAAEILKEKGINAEVINIHTIKPIDKETVIESVKKTGAAVVCENHNIMGGLYSAVAEVTARHCPVKLVPVGIPDVAGEVGKLPYLRERMHMTVDDVVNAALEAKGLL